jgi:hypothetical protein
MLRDIKVTIKFKIQSDTILEVTQRSFTWCVGVGPFYFIHRVTIKKATAAAKRIINGQVSQSRTINLQNYLIPSQSRLQGLGIF